jgi:hypothetical protein
VSVDRVGGSQPQPDNPKKLDAQRTPGRSFAALRKKRGAAGGNRGLGRPDGPAGRAKGLKKGLQEAQQRDPHAMLAGDTSAQMMAMRFAQKGAGQEAGGPMGGEGGELACAEALGDEQLAGGQEALGGEAAMLGGKGGLEGAAAEAQAALGAAKHAQKAGAGAFAEKLVTGKQAADESVQQAGVQKAAIAKDASRAELQEAELGETHQAQEISKQGAQTDDVIRQQVRVTDRTDDTSDEELNQEIEQQLFVGEVSNQLVMQRVQELAGTQQAEAPQPVQIPQEVIDKVVERARFGQGADGAHEFHVDLKQEVLDGAQMKVRTKDGQVTIEMISDDPQVQAKLEAQAQALQQSMAARGINAQVSVFSQAQADAREQERRGGRQQAGQAGIGGVGGAGGRGGTAKGVAGYDADTVTT